MSSGKSRFGFQWGSSAAAAPTYTPAERKGEVNELATQLSDPATEKDQARRRELLKKVLALMTLGVDTSSLFTVMIMACVTKDLVQKKMVYSYLCAHSESKSDIAILAINTLQKDCSDESPLVRGLALRSLSSLRLAQLAEYLVPVVKKTLVDSAPYVRKTAILASLKLFRVAPETFRSLALVDKMYGMLRDNDPLVSMNALAVLTEVTAEDGGVTVSKPILYFLLNRLRDMSEWQQTQVLQLAIKYTPANEDEMFDIMNLLEERLRGSNSGVIVACAHVFLHLTQNLPTVHRQVFDRLREPLLTLMATSNSVEASYAILCHVKLLAQREAKVFAGSYKDFYVRHIEPSFIKCVKMEILALIANEQSVPSIVGELAAYAGDSNSDVARLAITSMGRIALRLESAAKTVLDQFLDFLTLDVEHVRAQTLVVMKDFLRKHRDIAVVRPFLEALVRIYKDMQFTDDESKVALVWVLGEYGEHVEDAPYLIEGMATPTLAGESYALRVEILTSSVKLFFKRPPEMQPVLAAIFRQLINDFSHADVHDRALFYYRLLRQNVRAAAQVVCAEKVSVATFAEDTQLDERDKLFEEFNTFSVILARPAATFMRKPGVDDADDEDEDEDEEGDDDDDGEGEDDDENAGLLSHAAVELSEEVALEPADFQRKWGRLTPAATLQLKLKRAPPTTDAFEELMEGCNVMTLASGPHSGGNRFFLFAQEEGDTQTHFLVEAIVLSTGTANVTIKSDSPKVKAFEEHIKKIFARL